MLWFAAWMIALSTYERGAAELTDGMTPPGWTGNPWGPAATAARLTGKLPAISMTRSMAQWDHWGRSMLRDGDIVFRLGDARTLLGFLPLSRFIAHASGSAFSHTGIIAMEDGCPVVYDCSSSGIQRQPFAVWMLDSIGSFGVKRLKPHLSTHIAGVLGYCRKVFEDQVPFDDEFRIDDSRLYCVEMTEKAFRSEKLELSKPVCIGDWDNLVQYPLTATWSRPLFRIGSGECHHPGSAGLPAGQRPAGNLGFAPAGDGVPVPEARETDRSATCRADGRLEREGRRGPDRVRRAHDEPLVHRAALAPAQRFAEQAAGARCCAANGV